ncbi:CLUMA_CG006039, isoform A [Clunio marinus]|uniref:CLUMA_CG006039, isoform A n=1 Tax=Clunio marinus TaxID=568069 RepID=A0A1J1HWY2_9DIPT|nr:CLUMA_CG006039, isoform A [Clunio marinus]
MDRGKKTKLQHSNDFFALGKNDRKRDATSSSSSAQMPQGAKKTRIAPSTFGAGPSTSSPSESSQWEEAINTECENSVDLIKDVLQATEQQDSDKIVSLVCSAIKSLSSSKAKNDPILVMSLLYLGKIRPHIFGNELITAALLSILKTDGQHSVRHTMKNNSTIFVMAANLLARGHFDKKKWPESFIKVYIDDAINERLWVDSEECLFFVDNIVAAFGTKIPPQKPDAQQKELVGVEDESSDSFISESSRNTEELQLNSRFYHIQETVEKIVSDTIKDQFNRRQSSDFLTKNLLKFTSTACGIPEVRSLAVTRLELWIHNAKLVKPAQELLEYLCYNISALQTKDHEVLSQLLKMRLKTKPLINIYMNCLKDLINLQPKILHLMMKSVVQQELLILYNARNPNNMGILATIFQAKPEAAATNLAEIYQEFLLLRDDCLKTLRVFLRELVKTLRFDINLIVFCKALMSNRPEFIQQVEASEFRERCCFAIADLVCLCRFLSVSPQIRDAHNAITKTSHDQKSSLVYNFYNQMSQIQYESLNWMLEEVPRTYKLNSTDYSATVNKILILDPPESYTKGDQWPPEPERMLLMNLISEVPLLQDSILTIIFIGVNKDISFSIHDTVEIIDQMVRRACLLKYTDYPPLEITKLDIIDFLFSMAEYHHPENIQLPSGYEPPKLAISLIYWKVWIILLILSAHNTGTIGAFCWANYPMLKMLMEMCITNQFTMTKPPEDELQLSVIEKTQIIQFEGYLAAATSKVVINEQNSLLISQVMLMNPMGTPRRPPKTVLEQLHSLNGSHRLGHLLCRSRKPDLLLDIIQRQGTSQSMPWLSDLVQSSDGDFNHLPVQCLCEFLLSNSNSISSENTRDIELITFLQKMLQSNDDNDFQTSYEVLEYFLRRLSSTSRYGRLSAIQAFKLLLKSMESDESKEMIVDDVEADAESDWLLKYLPMIPSFPFICDRIIAQLRTACQVENSPDLIMIYIQFIATNTTNDPVTEMLDHVACWSLLIVERSCVFASILPKNVDDPKYQEKYKTLNYLFIMFNNFIIKMKENNSEITLPEYPELLVVHFADGTQCHMHLNFIHALVILLSESKDLNGAMELLDYFFPADSPSHPQAFSVDTDEKVQILPDWLKLKMIRSSIDRMVDVALQDLLPEQLILFIQSFGTPKNSMDKLLALLDAAVVQDPDRINEAIMNRAYLTQFIEIQQLRGATHGHIAMKHLKSIDNVDEEMEPRESKVVRKVEILEKFDVSKVKSKPSTSYRSGKFSSNYRVSSLLGDVLKETKPASDSSSIVGMKISESGRNIHHILNQLIHSTHPFDIESFAHQNLNIKNLKQSKLAALIDCMSVMLKEENDKLNVNKRGILIDWLVQFDSELIRTNQDVQLSLLFGKNIQIYRPYFLSLLIHQANWSTIAMALEKLLNQRNSGIYDPSSVLDFVDAIIRSPKLWQGRDKTVPKHEQIEYVLTLDDDKVKAFIDYILREEEMLIVTGGSKMNDRVTLLLNCVDVKELSLKMIKLKIEDSILEKRVKDKFMQRLYMNIPHLFLEPKSQESIAQLDAMTDFTGCASDKLSHTIITTLASLTNTRDFQALSQDVELTLRKLASTHPLLLLRELSLIASLLAGRGHMDFHVLRQGHHITFFNQILGVLELLRPTIFEDAYKNGLHRAINCYFHLLQNHSKDVYGLMFRLMEFLKTYASTNNVGAYQLINQNNNLFAELYMRNRNIIPLQHLMSSTHFSAKGGISVPSPLIPKVDNNQGSVVAKIGQMSKMTHDELLSTLQEIDYQTHKKQAQLIEIYGKLTELIFYSSSDVRNLAHSLLLKVLRQNPGNNNINSSCFNAYLQCLHSGDINITTSVLDNLTEIVLCLQEYASEILQSVFNLGITSKNNTLAPLKKCINAIKLQHGC